MSGYDDYGQQQGGGNYGAGYEGERRGEGKHFGENVTGTLVTSFPQLINLLRPSRARAARLRWRRL
jgi:hypothetical protein